MRVRMTSRAGQAGELVVTECEVELHAGGDLVLDVAQRHDARHAAPVGTGRIASPSNVSAIGAQDADLVLDGPALDIASRSRLARSRSSGSMRSSAESPKVLRRPAEDAGDGG